MIRVMVMANDSRLVKAAASILAEEIHPHVLQLSYHLSSHGYETLCDPRSMAIVIDDGWSKNELIKIADSFRDGPVLVIKACLKSVNIDLYKRYQLVNLGAEQVTQLVRDFRKTYLGRFDEEVVTWAT